MVTAGLFGPRTGNRGPEGRATLTESIWLVPGFDGVIVPHPATLHLTPLFGGRDHHQLGGLAPPRLDSSTRLFVAAWDDTRWAVRASGATFMRHPDWYRDFHYRDEAERGYPAHEDLWTPGGFNRPLAAGVVSKAGQWTDLARLIHFEGKRRPDLSHQAPWAELFLADQGHGQTAIVAGYPWFADWSRELDCPTWLNDGAPQSQPSQPDLNPLPGLRLNPQPLARRDRRQPQ